MLESLGVLGDGVCIAGSIPFLGQLLDLSLQVIDCVLRVSHVVVFEFFEG